MDNVRNDFLMLKQDIVYLDNSATTFKPKIVIDKMNEYYNNYCANAHRGDYDISYKVDLEYENVRELTQKFINAKYKEEIIFTSGTTESINMIVNGFFKNILTAGDEIIISQSEHASNILPWFNIAKNNNCQIKYIPLGDDYDITIENVKNTITSRTKVISLAHISNVIGDIRPIKEICEIAHKNDIYVVVDGAQSVPHLKVDVQELDCDFLTCSSHKMVGPTGVGILYGSIDLLEKMMPTNLGGGMNDTFDNDLNVNLKSLPHRLEAGTPNIAGVIGFGAAINYINNIGIEKIHEYEIKLREYLISKLIKISHVDIINLKSTSGIIAFNINGVFSQDVAYYLNKYNICVRAGNHCAKMLKNVIKANNTVRLSLYFYNSFEEIDNFIELISNKEKIMKEML